MSVPDRTGSIDSTYNLRHNPLNIRNPDGSDFTVPKKHISVPTLSSASSTDLLIHSLVKNNASDDDEHQLPPSMRIGLQKRKTSPNGMSQEEIDEFHKLMMSSRNDKQKEPTQSTHENQSDTRATAIEQEIANTLDALEGSSHNDYGSDFKFDYPEKQAKQSDQIEGLNSLREKPNLSDSVRELAIPSKPSREFKAKNDPFQLDFNFEECQDDLGKSLLDEFEQMNVSTGLGRKNTITAKGKVQTGPSRVTAMQARRVVKPKISRSEESDAASHLSISTPMLNAISFTPKSMESTDSAKSESFSVPESQTTVETAFGSTDNLLRRKSEKKPGEADNDSVYADAQGPEENFSWMTEQVEDLDKSDRGRLFLRIDGLQDTSMPMDYSRDPHFTMCLDNGIQSVRTYPIKFSAGDVEAKQTYIGQEFELLVGEKLNLVLTFAGQMNPLPRPEALEQSEKISRSVPSSPKKTETSPKKKRFSLFGSPKKKKQDSTHEKHHDREKHKKDKKNNLEDEKSRPQDVWKHLIGTNGEFARTYIEEAAFEDAIYGKPHTFLLPCYNEWTLHKVTDREDKSGIVRGMHLAKKPPYKVANLRVTMMYVPKVNNEEQLPSSMRECLEELQKAWEFQPPVLKGCLTQKGLDCNYWRRRWFTLSEGILKANTEETRRLRAQWKMQDVWEVIDMDRVVDDDDPCINSERAFRLVFRNGNKVNFYADSIREKNQWVDNLRASTAYSSGKPVRWTDLVIRRERQCKSEDYRF